MPDERQNPPSEATSADQNWPNEDVTEARLKKSEEIARNARPLWFVLLGFLAFCAVTLAGVEDADFFAFGASTDLPLLGVSVPTDSFFYAGPFLAAALYVHFHLYLAQLWIILAKLPRHFRRHPVQERHYPWLVIDAAMILRSIPCDLRGCARWVRRQFAREDSSDASTSGVPPKTSAFPLVILALAAVFVWAAGPSILVYFWIRAMPARDLMLVLWIAALLTFSLYVAIQSIRSITGLLRQVPARREIPNRPSDARQPGWGHTASRFPVFVWATMRRTPRAAHFGTGILLLLLLSVLGWRAGSSVLYQARLAEPPAAWQDYEIAKAEFRGEFAARMRAEHGTEYAWPSDWEETFEEEWGHRRDAEITNIRSRDLSGYDLRHADMRNAFLVGISLEEARLEGSNLRGARLEGANLRGARLEGANLRGARLEGANLQEARLEGANLQEARLDGADLREARLEGMDLRGVQMEGGDLIRERLEEALLGGAQRDKTDLWGPSLEGADLRGAHLEGALLQRAQLEGANLQEARLEGMNLRGTRLEGADLRDARLEETDLREARLVRADLQEARLREANLRKAQLEGADLRGAHLEGANLRGAQLEGALLWMAQLEGADLRGARLERAHLWKALLERADLGGALLEEADLHDAQLGGADLGGAQLKGADLRKAQLEGADLQGARLEGADLREAQLEGANLRGAQLEGADLREARLGGTDLREADLRRVTGLTQEQLNPAIGNAGTILPDQPEGLFVLDCWRDFPILPEGLEGSQPSHNVQYKNQVLCSQGREPQPTGTPVSELETH